MHEILLFFQKHLVISKKSSTFALAFEEEVIGAVVQLVRIHACHAWGREFESRPHRKEDANASSFVFHILDLHALVIQKKIKATLIGGFHPIFILFKVLSMSLTNIRRTSLP